MKKHQSFVVAIGLTLLTVPMLRGEEIAVSKATREKNVDWYDVRSLGVEGKVWDDTKSPFDRLPAKAEKAVRKPVWNLSRHSAGMCVRFESDSPVIHARWTLTSSSLAMAHMPATGVSGLDLYVQHEGRWKWLATGRPTGQTTQAVLTRVDKTKRKYMLYLPLYNGVKSLSVGIHTGSRLATLPRSPQSKPIVFYGTSITQGRLRVANGYGSHRYPRATPGPPGRESRILWQWHDGCIDRSIDGRSGCKYLRDRLLAEYGSPGSQRANT